MNRALPPGNRGVFYNVPCFSKFQKLILCCFLLLFVNAAAFAQTVIRGTVRDNENNALPGATVSAVGANVKVLTDGGGRFAITVPANVTQLSFSYVGLETQTLPINSRTTIDVALSGSNELDVVTVVGYGSVRKSDLTGAATTVSAKDFNKGPLNAPDQLIQGKVAGVQMINNSGQPGGSTTVRIRGNTAITGSGQPLYVVDGVALDNRSARPSASGGVGNVPGGNPLNFINPADIASMEVLKDASATAIYGSRAAYGVVLITTKRGQTGASKVDVSASAGVSNMAREIDVLDGDEYRAALTRYGVSQFDFGANVNAMDEITRSAYNQNYSLAVSGGNQDNTYRASFGYQDQQGIIRKTDFKKYSAAINGNFKFLDSKKLGMDVNLVTSQYLENIAPITTDAGFRGSLISQALSWNPTRAFRNPDGSLFIEPRSSIVNPLAMSEASSDKSKVSTILGSVSPYYKITDFLEYRMLASINYSTGIRRSSTRSYLNLPGIEADLPNFLGGFASYANSELVTQQFTNTLNFNKEIASKLNLNAVLGYEYTNYINKGLVSTARGFGDLDADYTDVMQATTPANRSLSSFNDPTTQLQSFFARAIFNYADKYLLTATFRADGSTKFGSENRYGYFPSFAAAWNIKNESFLTDVAWLNQLKIRAGYGLTGNQEFPSGAALQRYNLTYTGGPSTAGVNNANRFLKWQSDTQINLGADFGLFNNKLSGSIDYFHKKTTDLLFPRTPFYPSTPGASITWTNLPAEIINKGLELALSGSIIEKEDISWSLGGNATFMDNTVKNQNTGLINTGALSGQGLSDVTVQVIQSGLPLFAFVTREFNGLDANGFSTYTDEGYTYYYVGNPNPKVILGLTTNFRYKNLSLTANFNGSLGQDLYNNTGNSVLPLSNLGTGKNIASGLLNSPIQESLANPIAASSRYLEKGDYLKLANATINYNIGNVGKSIKALNIFVNGQNLFVITKFKGFDPEVNVDKNVNGVPSAGIEYISYPTARTFNFGVNFSL